MADKEQLEAVLLWLIKDKVLQYRNKSPAEAYSLQYKLDPTETKIADAIGADSLYGIRLIRS